MGRTMMGREIVLNRGQVWSLQWWPTDRKPRRPENRTLHIRSVDMERESVIAWVEEDHKEEEWTFVALQDNGQLTNRRSYSFSAEELADHRTPTLRPGDIAWYAPPGQINVDQINLVVVTGETALDGDTLPCIFLKGQTINHLPKTRLR